MIPQMSTATAASTKHDIFHLYDDGSALVDSMHGTAYPLMTIQRQGHTEVCGCECRGYEKRHTCRHKTKLQDQIAAQERLFEMFPRAGQRQITVENERCEMCGAWLVMALLWGVYEGCEYQGYRTFTVCGCGVKEAGL